MKSETNTNGQNSNIKTKHTAVRESQFKILKYSVFEFVSWFGTLVVVAVIVIAVPVLGVWLLFSSKRNRTRDRNIS